jgi:lysozyme family protein
VASFEAAIPLTLEWEGGYSSSPSDPGGETNFGISKRSYPSLDIRNLTREEACAIYRRDFWSYDGLKSQAIATKLFDAGVNLGTHRAVSYMQTVVGVPADGKYGPLTEGGINGSEEQETLQAYRQRLVAYYQELVQQKPNLQKFLAGWLRRAES